MRGKRFKFIYFSTSRSEVKEISLGIDKLAIGFLLAVAVVIAVTGIFLQLSTNFFQNVELSRLTRKNTELANMLSVMEHRVVDIEKKVLLVEKQDNDLRVFADLPKIDNDTRQLGVGGIDEKTFSSFAYSNDEKLEQAFKIKSLLSNLSQRMDLAYNSRQEIKDAYTKLNNDLAHMPSINPVPTGRIKSRFGYRTDPFTQKRRFHDGLDIAAARGTEIYAPASGRVESVRQRYSPGQGYGRYIVIDHGNGIKTRYAHLKNCLVKPGETVSRYALVATVGTSGRSTGPHLHYEVIVNGQPVNPLKYVFD